MLLLSLLLLTAVVFSPVQGAYPSGLDNPGNFCYRNALFQVLMRLPGIDFCDVIRDPVNQTLHNAMCATQTKMLQGGEPFSPDEVNQVIGSRKDLDEVPEHRKTIHKFADSTEQQDADEFFAKLDLVLRDELATFIGDLSKEALGAFSFFGFSPVVQEMLECRAEGCGGIREAAPASIYYLRVPFTVPENCDVDIGATLEKELRPETVDLRCETCGSHDNIPHIKTKQIRKFPRFLYVVAGRFEIPQDQDGQPALMLPAGQKKHNFVTTPLERFVIPGETRDKKPTYTLHGIVEHRGGTMKSGHYVARARVNGEWYLFNDSVVTPISDLQEVRRSQGYIFFYVRD